MRTNPKHQYYYRNFKNILVKKEYHKKAMEFAKKFHIPLAQLLYILIDMLDNPSAELLAKLENTKFQYRKREFKNKKAPINGAIERPDPR